MKEVKTTILKNIKGFKKKKSRLLPICISISIFHLYSLDSSYASLLQLNIPTSFPSFLERNDEFLGCSMNLIWECILYESTHYSLNSRGFSVKKSIHTKFITLVEMKSTLYKQYIRETL